MSATSAHRSSPPPVTLPELAVPPHVFVLSLPADGPPDQLLDQWLEQSAELPDSSHPEPLLAGHREEMLAILSAACGEAQVGEVAAFLSYRQVSTGSGGSSGSGGSGGSTGSTGSGATASRLVGGTALLTLELLDPMPGSPQDRVERLAAELRRTADRLGHGDGLAEITSRRTASGVPAVRLRFLAVLDASPPETRTPMVEACRWLFPVPGHGDLAWSLVYQSADIAEADEVVAEFDQLAASLTWVEP